MYTDDDLEALVGDIDRTLDSNSAWLTPRSRGRLPPHTRRLLRLSFYSRRLMHEMVQAGLNGDVRTGRAINDRLQGLHKQLFCESSPAPTKWALSQMGRCRNVLRLPIVELSAAGQATVGQALRESGIL